MKHSKQLILSTCAAAGLLIAPTVWAQSKLSIESTKSGYELVFPGVAKCGEEVHVCREEPDFCAGGNIYLVPLGENWPGGKDPSTIPTEGLASGTIGQTGKVSLPVPTGQKGLWGKVLVTPLFAKGKTKCWGGHPDYPNEGEADGPSLARNKTNQPVTAFKISRNGKHDWLSPSEKEEVKRTLD